LYDHPVTLANTSIGPNSSATKVKFSLFTKMICKSVKPFDKLFQREIHSFKRVGLTSTVPRFIFAKTSWTLVYEIHEILFTAGRSWFFMVFGD